MYDINTETKAGRKRLRQIFKLMKKYLIRIQNSVFEGELTKAKFEELKLKVNDLIDSTIDSVIFFKSRDIKWMDKEICGFEKVNVFSIVPPNKWALTIIMVRSDRNFFIIISIYLMGKYLQTFCSLFEQLQDNEGI